MGTNYIAPTWRQPENLNKDKLSNYSIDTAGTDGIDCGPMADLFGTASVTYNTSYSIWIKPEFNYNDSTYQTFYGNYTTGNNGVLLYYHTGDDRWRFLVGDGSGNGFVNSSLITSNEELGKGEWQHHCVVFDTVNNNAYYYINNQQVNSGTTLNRKIATNADFYIGKKWDLSSGTFSGLISQGCVFDYALSDGTGGTANQIEYLYNLNNPMAISGAKPVAYWPLGDNSNTNATAGYPNISVGADSVFQFNSSGNRIDLGLESNLSLGGASKYSTSLWFKKNSNVTNCLWGYNYGDSNGSGFYLWQTSGNFRVAVGNNSLTTGFGYYTIAASNIPIGEWTNIVVVFDGTLASGDDRIKVYQNGEAATGTYTNGSGFPATLPTGNGASNRNVYLGQLQLGGGGFAYSYDGQLSNVQQWDTDLSLANANDIYNNGQPLMTGTQPQEANLQAWYKLNQTATWTGSVWSIPDDSTNSNTATSVGMNTTNLVQSDLTRKLPFSNYSINLDGLDYFKAIGTDFEFGNGTTDTSFSISTWVKLDSIGSTWVSCGSTTQRRYRLATRGTGVLTFELYSNNTSSNSLVFDSTSTTLLTTGTWYNVIASYDASAVSLKIFVNGQEVVGTLTNDSYTAMGTGSTEMNFGRFFSNGTTYLEGFISNFCFYKQTISDEEALNIYNNGIPSDLNSSSTPGAPYAWFPMDQNYTYFNGTVLVARDNVGALDLEGVNVIQSDIVGNAPGSEANGTGTNLTIADLKGDMKSSINNSYSINMADYADGVTNPADSGRSTNVP